MKIPFESDSFPTQSGVPRSGSLSVSWSELIWAALTVGRPSYHDVFQHGASSEYEAIFRISLLRMALSQSGPAGSRIRRTNLFNRMDPTEKGAINYFLGMAICKLFAWKLLHTPWTLHLDVYRDALGAEVAPGRSRPDLVGESLQGQWHAFESKGRASVPSHKEKQNAKVQANRLISVGGINCTLHIGAITYFQNNALRFYWRDPEPIGKAIELPEASARWRAYYEPVASLLQRSDGSLSSSGREVRMRLEEFDLDIRLDATVANLLVQRQWAEARELARTRSIEEKPKLPPDGLNVEAGPSWSDARTH